MKKLRPLLLALACALPALAMAQWQWLDKDGRKVFSDRPPPSDIPANRVLKQPAGSSAAPAAAPADATAAPGADPAAAGATTTAAAPAQAAASMPRPSGKDKGLEAKKKEMEAAAAEKKKQEDAKFALARAENCNRAKSSKATFDSGIRIARTNAKGEREILDDKQRDAEVKRLEGIIAKECA
ncbi:DUF4124 domain-containing protein [Caenimonas sedimenti]|uniref:DUF4124 domain-containing protein n=1 Tax=Caenimonas sedimenti TaxID=2596921 RepID=A0A562ZTU4_9BURK|nr:DUF4124 domain-containing protein [Caenimonas sedimenti]TWO71827.1 DUF4124 domain-containing protein [Caenimonas sedimenti]